MDLVGTDPLERAGMIAHRPIAGDTTVVRLALRRRKVVHAPVQVRDLHAALVARARHYQQERASSTRTVRKIWRTRHAEISALIRQPLRDARMCLEECPADDLTNQQSREPLRRTRRRTCMNRNRRLTSVAAFLLVAFVAAGCASSSDDAGADLNGDAGGADPAAAVAEDRPAAEAADGAALDSGASVVDAADAADAVEDERALISQGNVQLRSDDVGEALFEVQKVVDELAGEISQNETATDDDGEVKRARVVARIPSARFGEAMKSLEGAATLIASTSNVDDVTTTVIDNEIRLQVQKRSIRRIAVLLDRAESIRDIVSIESQLSRRQAALGSLQRQQSYLADQTSMATITVSLERTKAKAETKEKKQDEKGFLAGLDKGWTGFKTVAVSLATATGAALPFLVVLALLGVPAWSLVRRAARRRPAPTKA